ncbi:MAG: hypothetical protein ACKOE6_11230, partial [Flammeovirgaceae bacterium]
MFTETSLLDPGPATAYQHSRTIHPKQRQNYCTLGLWAQPLLLHPCSCHSISATAQRPSRNNEQHQQRS